MNVRLSLSRLFTRRRQRPPTTADELAAHDDATRRRYGAVADARYQAGSRPPSR